MASQVNNLFSYKYLTKNDIKGFDNYKYSAIDTSPLSQYVMHPTWNTIVKFIPNFVAPNLLTFAGFLCMVLDVVLLSYWDYDCTASGQPAGYTGTGQSMPGWVLTLCGVSIFIAYNLDGLDGKQARKIGVSGPLGEMFDHGLDSWIVFFIPFCLFSVFGRDHFSLPAFRGFLIVMSVTLNFYVSHCEKYNTGTLYLPWGYDLSMWVVPIIFIMAGVQGPQVFKFYVYEDKTFLQLFEVIIHATGLLTTLPVAVYNVYLSYQNKTGKMYSFFEALRPVWSMLLMTLILVTWVLKSPTDIIERDPRAFLLLYGTLFSNVSSRLIVSEMSGQRCESVCWLSWPLFIGFNISLRLPHLELAMLYSLLLFTILAHVHYGVCVSRLIVSEMSGQRCESVCWLSWPLFIGFNISLRLPHLELAMLYSLLLFTILAHVHYGVCVVRQICDHFKIKCFTVPKTKRKLK